MMYTLNQDQSNDGLFCMRGGKAAQAADFMGASCKPLRDTGKSCIVLPTAGVYAKERGL